jgi:hypothetical protein
MAYGARSATISSAGAPRISRISRDIAVVRLALGIGDDRNRHFAEYLTAASGSLKPKHAVNHKLTLMIIRAYNTFDPV